jgi:putative endonuclease
MVTVYVLRSQSTMQHYVGITKNLPRRLEEHNQGRNRATRNRGPWNLLYTEQCPDYASARKHERFLKSGPGHAFIKQRVQ